MSVVICWYELKVIPNKRSQKLIIQSQDSSNNETPKHMLKLTIRLNMFVITFDVFLCVIVLVFTNGKIMYVMKQ